MFDKIINILSKIVNILKRILLIIYVIVIYKVGVYHVPVRTVWGQNNIFDLRYVPIWELVDKKPMGLNVVRYELCVSRAVYQIGLITLIAIALYFALEEISKLFEN
ncbi:hypothetical protein [Caloranaerobacter azorensis]|uniref:hypothetical protein n=1 Tax=Caloranaerobacter azorensis TaxID=116090 RepID=UPI00068A5CA9|nr:hypothetical protein [Caloranaerobacter azorensis]